MAITLEEAGRLRRAYEQTHAPITRAMADLLLHGNVILEDHGLLDGAIGDAFEAFVHRALADHGITPEAFGLCVRDLGRIRETLDELNRLP